VRSGATGWLPPIVVALAAHFVAGCASLPPELLPSDTFSIVGRVAVRYGDEAASGRVTWRHGVATDDLLISSPLGQGIAEITRRDGVYTLVTAKDERFTAADPERLTDPHRPLPPCGPPSARRPLTEDEPHARQCDRDHVRRFDAEKSREGQHERPLAQQRGR